MSIFDRPKAEVEMVAQLGQLLRDAGVKFTQNVEVPVGPPAEPGFVSLDSKFSKLSKETLRERAPANYAEVERIIALPFTPPFEPGETEAFTRANVLARAYEDGFRLHEVQARAVNSFDLWGGIFCPIAVGFGKTLIDIMTAERHYKAGGLRSILLVPASVLRQFFKKHLPYARQRVPISVTFHEFSGKVSTAKREGLLKAKWRGCYVISYEVFSHAKSAHLLDALEPDLLIGDEAHRLADPHSTRGKRFTRYLVAHPELKCAFLSGTITGKRLKDYWHLAKAALKERCPLPLSSQLAEEWGMVIDSGAAPSDAQAGPLVPLIDWARRHDVQPPPTAERPDRYPRNVSGFRASFRLRLTSSPGVIATGEAEIGTSLTLANSPAPWDPDKNPDDAKLLELARQVEELWVTPTGDEIDHAIHKYKWMYELSAGFYNELYWPTADVLAEKRKVSPAEATNLLERAKEHHAAHQFYLRELRAWLKGNARPGLDSPWLVGGSMARYGARDVGEELFIVWSAMKSLEFEGMPERWSRVIRVSPYKLKHVVRWAEALPKGKGAVLWVYHVALGEWLVELLREAGLNVLHCPAGENEGIVDPVNADRLCVASLAAHSIGKDGMQEMFDQQFFVQWPRDAKQAEQALGRLHRQGQKADELVAFRCDSLPFDLANFGACLNDAVYIHSTTGLRQKLVYATYDPLPAVYPDEWLNERGFQAKRLTKEQRGILSERFGAEI